MWIDYVAKYLMVMEKPPEPLDHGEKDIHEPFIDWTQMEY